MSSALMATASATTTATATTSSDAAETATSAADGSQVTRLNRLSSSCPKSQMQRVVRKLCTAAAVDPLWGCRVLDLTRIVAGPYCTQLLGDLGAQVLKVENPRGGDESRRWGPPYVGDSDLTCYFVCLNRNKKSICIDMKSAQGISVMYDIVKKCDVLVENYVPGKLDKMGLGYDKLKEIAPHLIYCSITGYGPDGPYSKKPGYDVIAAGYGGLLSITGDKDGGPVKPGVAVTDLATGLHAYGSIMAAMLLRHRTGKGQKIDCNLLSTQVASLINIGSNYLNAGEIPTRWGTEHASIVPYQAFPTSDGHLIIGTGSDDQFRSLCEMLQVKHLSDNEKFNNNKSRVKNREELISILSNILQNKSTADWLKILENGPFPCGPVNAFDKVFEDEHIQDIKLVENINHPVSGSMKVVGPPTKFSNGGNKIRSPPPLLGEHTDEVLFDLLGYTKDKIASLKDAGIVL